MSDLVILSEYKRNHHSRRSSVCYYRSFFVARIGQTTRQMVTEIAVPTNTMANVCSIFVVSYSVDASLTSTENKMMNAKEEALC